ncbi:MAG: BamA/TamA family outer membrane protein, partial [Steroidobacteraceae bacterium]
MRLRTLAATCAVALLGAPAAAGAPGSTPAAESAPPTFIPIPEIDTDPYSGLTLGVIPTLLHTNAQQQIEEIIAPDVIHSQYFGWGSRMRIFGFPSADAQYSVVGGLKERVEREFDGRYTAGQTRATALSWSVEAIYDRSGVPRFFGLGNDSRVANQTNYLDDQARLDAQLGYNFSPALQLAVLARVRYVDVLPGVLPGLPSIQTRFPGLKGIGAGHELQQRLILTYDTRDSVIIPTSGARYLLYGGFASRALGSSVSYSYLGAEARHYWPLGRDVTLAWHATARYMLAAANAPFWALSSLGGDRSVPAESEPLRSDGADRYLDRNLFASGVELRARVLNFNAFGTRVSL